MGGWSSNASASCRAWLCVEVLADIDPEQLAVGRLRFERIVEPERLIVPVGIELPDADAPLRRCLGSRFQGGRHEGERYTPSRARRTSPARSCAELRYRRTENSRQVPGTPLSSCSPRSSNSRPDPTTRSLTVLETRTSRGPASAEIRAPMWTASPAMSSGWTSISPRGARRGSRARARGRRRGSRPRSGPPGPGRRTWPGSRRRRLDLVARRTARADAGARSVLAEQRLPAGVAELGRPLRRADDVGEQDGRQHAMRLRRRADAGDEGLDLGDDRVLVAGPDQVVGARQLDVLGRRDVLGEVAAVVDGEARCASAGG